MEKEMKMASMWRSCVLAVVVVGVIISAIRAAESADVLDTSGQVLKYGANDTTDHTFAIRNATLVYNFPFYFGLGKEGDAVETDTELTLGISGQTLLLCDNGTGLPTTFSSPPPHALFKIVLNSSSYYLQLSSSPNTAIHLSPSVSGASLNCTPGVEPSPIVFVINNSTSSSFSPPSILPFLPLVYLLLSLSLIILSSPSVSF